MILIHISPTTHNIEFICEHTNIIIVPILALTFGLSKGFGLEEKIYEVMNENFANHRDILDQVMEFTGNMLERTKGGIVAGVGVVVLIYSVISMIRHIEKAVENVLGIHSGRKFLRVVTDYLALLLICPVLLVIAGSVTLLFNSFAVGKSAISNVLKSP